MQFKDLQAYEILEKRPIKDLNSEGIILRHKKSGARIAVISNDELADASYICVTCTKTCQIYKKVLEVLGGFCYAAGNCKMV